MCNFSSGETLFIPTFPPETIRILSVLEPLAGAVLNVKFPSPLKLVDVPIIEALVPLAPEELSLDIKFKLPQACPFTAVAVFSKFITPPPSVRPPATTNFTEGLAVPIPTLPTLSIRILCAVPEETVPV